MKKNDVKVGETYHVKVSGNIAKVRLTNENPHGGWDGVNVDTNRKVRIKSAQRLRGPATDRPAKREKVNSLEQVGKPVETTVRGTPKGRKIVTKAEYERAVGTAAGVGTRSDKPAKATTGANAGEKADTGGHRRRYGTMSGLDAAATVLAGADEPMSAKEIVLQAAERGLWRSEAKTPHATVYAAMTREIADKGDLARFKKVARGKFIRAK